MPHEPPLEHPSPEHARPPDKTWRILLLDRAENVEQLKSACKECGYVVVGATTIDEAWAFLEGKDHADVIVCAAHLEEESMFEFLRAVRRSEVHRKSAFLILSLEPSPIGARSDRAAASTAMLLGADAFVSMPVFNAVALMEQLQRVRPSVPLLTLDQASKTDS